MTNELIKKTFPGWGFADNRIFPLAKVFMDVPPSLYTISWYSAMQRYCLTNVDIKTDELIFFNDSQQEMVLDDIETFWNSEEQYKKFSVNHKRSVLLYGAPGCGKTGILMKLLDNLFKMNGLAIQITQEDDLSCIANLINEIKAFDEKKKIVLVLEDVDCYASGKNASILLNILDGGFQYSNFVTVATTNYPDLLEERFVNRPGRFNLRIEIKKPDYKMRSAFLTRKFAGMKTEEEIIALSKNSEGFTLDHLKELFVLIAVNGFSDEAALARIDDFIKRSTLTRPKLTEIQKVCFNTDKTSK